MIFPWHWQSPDIDFHLTLTSQHWLSTDIDFHLILTSPNNAFHLTLSFTWHWLPLTLPFTWHWLPLTLAFTWHCLSSYIVFHLTLTFNWHWFYQKLISYETDCHLTFVFPDIGLFLECLWQINAKLPKYWQHMIYESWNLQILLVFYDKIQCLNQVW